MSGNPPIVAEEEAVLARVVPALRALQSEDGERERALVARARELHRQWTDARGDPAQREAFEEALAEAKRALDAHNNARKSRDLPVGTPYFGRMALEEAERGGVRRQEVLLGKVGVVEGPLRIVDWRDAPVSQLYYQYDEGDAFAETIAGREREGTLAVRRRVDVREGALVEVQGALGHYRLRPDGSWATPGKARVESDDHRLPDIVSLITRDQFEVITRADAGVVLLRGRAGSGKTTVALHRIAYLHFQDARRFRPERMLVVMFNKALQTYISRVLPDLGVAGVPVETFHGWALRMLRSGQLTREFRSNASPAVGRIKRHPAMGALLAAHVARLGEKSAGWVREQLGESGRAAFDGAAGAGWARIAAARRRQPGAWWPKLRQRLLDHPRDLYGLFEDDALCREVLPASLHAALPAARKNQARCAEESCFDWEDAALLLRLGQLKHQADAEVPCPWSGLYAHLVIDEAQDLSTVEIEALVDAADAGRSVTIAGDPAQKILADAQFEGFEQLLRRLTGQVEVRLDALAVGHRSTRPIMELAIAALAHAPAADPAVIAARDGEPVEWLEGEGADAAAVEAVRRFREQRPSALVAVLAKGKATADAWARRLEAAGLSGVRRVARADFSFQPGVVVSNVHQVKGLEFDGVVLVEPAEFGELDRHLLHVAITRAADRLWVVAGKGRGVLR